jgi:hypothetical protein
VAQLEAEIAQLKDALARRQQIGVATGLLAQRFAHHPERAWSLWCALPINGYVKVRDIAQVVIDAALRSTQQAEVEILGAIEMRMPAGVRMIGVRVEGQQPTSESLQWSGLDTSLRVDHDRAR